MKNTIKTNSQIYADEICENCSKRLYTYHHKCADYNHRREAYIIGGNDTIKEVSNIIDKHINRDDIDNNTRAILLQVRDEINL